MMIIWILTWATIILVSVLSIWFMTYRYDKTMKEALEELEKDK